MKLIRTALLILASSCTLSGVLAPTAVAAPLDPCQHPVMDSPLVRLYIAQAFTLDEQVGTMAQEQLRLSAILAVADVAREHYPCWWEKTGKPEYSAAYDGVARTLFNNLSAAPGEWGTYIMPSIARSSYSRALSAKLYETTTCAKSWSRMTINAAQLIRQVQGLRTAGTSMSPTQKANHTRKIESLIRRARRLGRDTALTIDCTQRLVKLAT